MFEAVLFGIGMGVLGYMLGRLLDSCLDYGGLFGSIRWRLAMYYARGDIELRTQLRSARDIDDFVERLQECNALYWRVATRKFWFTGWICPDCLTGRVVVVGYLAGVLLNVVTGVAPIFVGLIVALSLAHVIGKIE